MSQDRAVDEGLHETASRRRTHSSPALALEDKEGVVAVVEIAGGTGSEDS